MSVADGKRAAYTTALSVLDRARQTSRGWKATELRQHLWLESTRLTATQATTAEFIRGIQLGIKRICDVHLYPPTDVFYPGDSDYTHRVVAHERECRSTYTDCV